LTVVSTSGRFNKIIPEGTQGYKIGFILSPSFKSGETPGSGNYRQILDKTKVHLNDEILTMAYPTFADENGTVSFVTRLSGSVL
jgi:hypothetical protein